MRLARVVALAGVLSVLSVAASPALAYGLTGHVRVAIENSPFANDDETFAAVTGAIVSDIGLVIPSHRPFSDAVHYVRSGEFAAVALRLARTDPRFTRDRRLLAFAWGLLTHHSADRLGHHMSTNVLVGRMHQPPGPRLAYERDPCLHAAVEMRLAVFDAKDATPALERFGRWVLDPNRSTLERAVELLSEVFPIVYPGVKLALRLEDLLQLLRLSEAEMRLAQEAHAKAFGAPSPTMYAKRVGQLSLEESLASFMKAVQRAMALPLPPDAVDVYNRSRDLVARDLKGFGDPALGPDQIRDYNLDTNLPSMGGQYVCADVAFKLCAAQASQLHTVAAERLRAVYGQYRDDGSRVRAQLTEYLDLPRTSENVVDPGLGELVLDLLEGIGPRLDAFAPRIRIEQPDSCKGTKGVAFRLGESPFVFDIAGRRLCAPQRARRLETLYGLRAGQELLSLGDGLTLSNQQRAVEHVKHGYDEGVEQLRLGPADTPDKTTLLYVGPCASCK